MKSYPCSAATKLEELEEQDRVTHYLIHAVQSTIIDHVLNAREAHAHLDANVIDILNSAANQADTALTQDTRRRRRKERWRERMNACAKLYNYLDCQPLREMVEDRLPQEMCDMIYKQVKAEEVRQELAGLRL